MSRDERPCVQQGVCTSYSLGKHKAAHKLHTCAAQIMIYWGFEKVSLRGKSVVNSGDEAWSATSLAYKLSPHSRTASERAEPSQLKLL
jgi:hypothetical protein